MSYIVSNRDLSKITLGETDLVKSVLQNIRIILLTPKFSVPLYRDFGLSMDFLDRPLVAAKPLLIAAIRDAIAEYEPRAEVLNIELETDVTMPGKFGVKVEVNIRNEE